MLFGNSHQKFRHNKPHRPRRQTSPARALFSPKTASHKMQKFSLKETSLALANVIDFSPKTASHKMQKFSLKETSLALANVIDFSPKTASHKMQKFSLKETSLALANVIDFSPKTASHKMQKFSLIEAKNTLSNGLARRADSANNIAAVCRNIALNVGCDSAFAQKFAATSVNYFLNGAGSKFEGVDALSLISCLTQIAAAGFTLDPAAANVYIVPYKGVLSVSLSYMGIVSVIQRKFPDFFCITGAVLSSEIATTEVEFEICNGKPSVNIKQKFDALGRASKTDIDLYKDLGYIYIAPFLNNDTCLGLELVSRAEIERLRGMSSAQKDKGGKLTDPAGAWAISPLQMAYAKAVRKACNRTGLRSADMGFPDEYRASLSEGGEVTYTPIEYSEYEEVFSAAEMVVSEYQKLVQDAIAQIEQCADIEDKEQRTKAVRNVARTINARTGWTAETMPPQMLKACTLTIEGQAQNEGENNG
jgi:recombinational DNA repair protein RecT